MKIQQRMVTIEPKDLIGHTFLKDSEEDGQRFRAQVVRAIVDKEYNIKKGPKYVKAICKVPNSTFDELFTYNEILDHIERDSNDADCNTEQLYKFRCITAHQGPPRTSDSDYKESTYNVIVKWETGETTHESLDMIASDDPVSCAEYAIKHDLLTTTGWKRFRSYSSNQSWLKRIINQAKAQSYRRELFWKFGVLVPRTYLQALDFDKKNGNTKWKDAEATEMRQLLEYPTFVDKGKDDETLIGYKKIRPYDI
jgi:hypothetical protein